VKTEWELHPVIFQALTLIWDRPLIDLFPTSLNYKLETFVSPVSNPRPESLGSGCNDHLLERGVQLHLPTISSSPQDFTQDKRGWLQDHSYSSGFAKTILVPASPTIIVCKTASSSLERGPFVSIQGKEASSRPGETPFACIVAVRTSIRQRGFSEKATKRISGAVRQSTGAIYDSKWPIFCSWCLSKQKQRLYTFYH
jgi:hypothetical protein